MHLSRGSRSIAPTTRWPSGRARTGDVIANPTAGLASHSQPRAHTRSCRAATSADSRAPPPRGASPRVARAGSGCGELRSRRRCRSPLDGRQISPTGVGLACREWPARFRSSSNTKQRAPAAGRRPALYEISSAADCAVAARAIHLSRMSMSLQAVMRLRTSAETSSRRAARMPSKAPARGRPSWSWR